MSADLRELITAVLSPNNRGTSGRIIIGREDEAKLREALAAPFPAEQPSNPVPLTDAALLDWLQEQMVDTIYLDAGGIIDVQSGDLRGAIRARIVGQQTNSKG